MALQISRSLTRAQHVVNLIMSCDEGLDVDGYVEAYQNGREQGLLITGFADDIGHGRTFFIAEHRNVDDVVVYYGDFSMQALSEDAWKHPNFFKTEEEAAKFIIETATPLTKEKRENFAKWLAEEKEKEKADLKLQKKKVKQAQKLPKPGKAKKVAA